MNPTRTIVRVVSRRAFAPPIHRPLSTSITRYNKEQDGRIHSNAEGYREDQKNKPLNPHMTNTNSAESQSMPNIGRDKAPPEFLSTVDPDFTPKDKEPENTERMTGGTQSGNPDQVSSSDLGVGEMEGASFRVEPLRRVGEDAATMRARLLCPSTWCSQFLTENNG